MKYLAEKEFVLTNEGAYVSDMLLFPDTSEEESLLNQSVDIPNVQFDENINMSVTTIIGITLIMLVLVIVGFYSSQKRAMNNRNNGETSIHANTHANQFSKENKFVGKNVAEGMNDEKDICDQIIDYIKSEQGRTTQKEIRKKFPMSEAKISLIIKELEAKQVVQKIKKGKGNIIILRK
jgi:uncharacterized membrane protein